MYTDTAFIDMQGILYRIVPARLLMVPRSCQKFKGDLRWTTAKIATRYSSKGDYTVFILCEAIC